MVDVHAEATSEKMALAHHLDGRVSLVAGTHTHVPTADARILPGGTGYITDLGMTGDYDSVIGMDKAGSLQNWRTDLPGQRLQPRPWARPCCAPSSSRPTTAPASRAGSSRSALAHGLAAGSMPAAS